MPANHREPTRVTRSISFRFDTIAALDFTVGKQRSDRSSFVNDVMEHILGIMPHHDIVGANVPFKRDTTQAWLSVAKEIEAEAKPVKPRAKATDLVKRPTYGRK